MQTVADKTEAIADSAIANTHKSSSGKATAVASFCSEANCSIVNSLLENNKTVFRGWDSAMAMRGNVFRNDGTVYESRTAFGQADTTPDPVERNNPQR